jgi:hypothetical protein
MDNNMSGFHSLSNEVIMNINMFCMCVELVIAANHDGGLVVTMENRGLTHVMSDFIKERLSQ